MLTAQQNLEIPMWRELAKAVISRSAQDYIIAMMVLNGEKVPKTANNVAIYSKPEQIRDDCETFFFSGWFRVLSADTGLDGMVLATAIESDWREMYDRMQHAKSGRPIEPNSGAEETKQERKRRLAREKYWRKKARMMAKYSK